MLANLETSVASAGYAVVPWQTLESAITANREGSALDRALELGVDVLLVGGEGRKEGGGVRRKVGVLSVLARPLSQQNKQAPSDQRLSQPSKPFFPTPSN
jgi:hypothetical protein